VLAADPEVDGGGGDMLGATPTSVERKSTSYAR
jgi:hypothetical protein